MSHETDEAERADADEDGEAAPEVIDEPEAEEQDGGEDVSIFDDDQPAADGEPVSVAPAPARRRPTVRDRWDAMSNAGRAVTVIAVLGVAFVASIVLAGMVGQRADEPAPLPPTMPPVEVDDGEAQQPVTPSTVEQMRVIQSAVQRPPGNPLVGLPDIHPAVVLYAGSDAQLFVNRLNEIASMQGTAKDLCAIWFGLAGGWWKLTDERWHPGAKFPNDVYFARAFTGAPCRPFDVVAEPVLPPPIWPTATTTAN